MQKMNFLASFFLIILLFTGCATVQHVTGRPIDEVKVNQIKRGETSLNDIISLFGAPQTTSKIGDKTLYIYQYCVTKGSAFATQYTHSTSTTQSCDELTITFDSKAMVEAFSYLKDPDR